MEDGTGEAQLYVYDETIQTLLKLSSQQWRHLQDLAMRTGELLYQRLWRGGTSHPQVQRRQSSISRFYLEGRCSKIRQEITISKSCICLFTSYLFNLSSYIIYILNDRTGTFFKSCRTGVPYCDGNFNFPGASCS